MKVSRLFPYLWLLVTLIVFLKPINTEIKYYIIPFIDKYVHFFFFFVLTVLWKKEINIEFNFSIFKTLLIVSLIVIPIAIITEYLQRYVKGRLSDIYDFGFNILGFFCGLIFFLIIKKLKIINI